MNNLENMHFLGLNKILSFIIISFLLKRRKRKCFYLFIAALQTSQKVYTLFSIKKKQYFSKISFFFTFNKYYFKMHR